MKPKCRILHIKMSWIDHHKKFEQKLLDGTGDSEPLINSGSGGKFPTYPRTETLNEAVGLTIQKPHVCNHGCSKDFCHLAYSYGGSNGGKLIFNNAVFGLAKQNAQVCHSAHGCSNVLADSAIDFHENTENCEQVRLQWSCSSIAKVCTLGF